MAALPIRVPFPVFYDQDGQPVDNGRIYIGTANLDPVANAIPTYYDEGLSIAASQPIITSGGYPVYQGTPTNVFVNAPAYSITVKNSDNTLVYSDLFVSDGDTLSVSLAELPDVPASEDSVIFLNDSGREGQFICRAGATPSDPLEGIYVDSNTPNFYWERVWDGINCLPEWFGAVIDNAGVDSYAAFAGALAVTGILTLGKGVYYLSGGLSLPAYSVVKGMGALHTAVVVNNATDHLMSQIGVFPGTYIGGANLQGFGLSRGVAAAIPANPADDKTQGHGLHFSMCSNPIVEDVYTYNNLAEIYVSNVLSIDFATVRGLNLTGPSQARWYGLWVDGASPIGSFGGPSPNPSARISQINMAGGAAPQSYGYYLQGAIQDLWIDEMENAGCSKGVFIDSNSSACGDVHLNSIVSDGYGTHGIHVLNTPQGSSLFMLNPWIAGRSGATAAGIRVESSHGINIVGATADGVLSTGVYMFHLSNSSNVEATLTANNYVTPCYMISASSCNINVKAFKNIAGGGVSGSIIEAVGGAYTSLTAAGNNISQGWVSGISIDASVTTYMLNVVGVNPAAVTNRITQATVAVTTQGNVGGNIIFNPGAGAML